MGIQVPFIFLTLILLFSSGNDEKTKDKSSSLPTRMNTKTVTISSSHSDESLMKNLRESKAYPPVGTRSVVSRMQYFLRQNTRLVGISLAVGVFLFIINVSSDPYSTTSRKMRGSTLYGAGGANFAGAVNKGYFSVDDAKILGDNNEVTGFRFGFLTDLDELSRDKEARKMTFQSHFVLGKLMKKATDKYQYEITFDAGVRHLKTKHNEAGRGAEFSELTVFDGRLFTADDRTGDVFEILNTKDGSDSYVTPRLVVGEGPGDTDKGMKWEWSTVKDGEMYLGSMGKEFTNKEGEIENRNNLWISIVNKEGQLRRVDWTDVYQKVREAVNAVHPNGYVIIEACNWSETMQQWVFMPRRISQESYDDVKDERRGARKVIFVSKDFQKTKVVDLNLESDDPLEGFSSFAFVPGTNDEHVLAIRSIEQDCALDDDSLCKQRSFVVAIDIKNGIQLSPEVKYDENWKFEGLEFFDPYVKPPEGALATT